MGVWLPVFQGVGTICRDVFRPRPVFAMFFDYVSGHRVGTGVSKYFQEVRGAGFEFDLQGTGIQRVFEQVAQAGLPEPTIEEVIDRVRVTIHVLSHNPADVGERGESLSRSTKSPSRSSQSLSRVTKSEQPVTKSSHQVESPSHETRNADDHRAAILCLLNDAEMTRTDLLSRLGLSNETRNVRRHLDPLIDAGLVERTIPDKPTSRLQRYRITDAGHTYLDRLSGDVK